jgi:hypothetical protein
MSCTVAAAVIDIDLGAVVATGEELLDLICPGNVL